MGEYTEEEIKKLKEEFIEEIKKLKKGELDTIDGDTAAEILEKIAKELKEKQPPHEQTH